ncbi:hypothetical protein NC653_015974 [Populus alba x Populus x berolinensis]|uniref:Uncharacterized protein n=1 Tax=Populus alba x Populus x berolinensis TaxID=444605 RepID=A0AAD6QLR2_9ROSI|nr:hypothetical protein NC653_015974 [Populus alba x Populus x berolinensis]
MGGGMEANKNKFIEDWGSARETLEQNFRWTRRNFALIGIFGIAVPILVYKGIVKEFNMQDEDAGRPYRKFIHSCPINRCTNLIQTHTITIASYKRIADSSVGQALKMAEEVILLDILEPWKRKGLDMNTRKRTCLIRAYASPDEPSS